MITASMVTLAAAASDGEDALVVGAGTLGIELGGALVGGLAGVAAVQASCSGPCEYEAWASIGVGVLTTGAGAIGGGLAGASLMPRVVGRRSGPAVAGAAVGLGIGTSMLVAGAATGEGALVGVGVASFALGMPLGAAVGVTFAGPREGSSTGSVSLIPDLSPGYTGARLSGRF